MKKVVLLAIAGLTLASVVAYAQMQHQGHGNHEGKMGPGMMRGGMMRRHRPPDAMDILKERYARGEINEAEYRERRRLLEA